MMVGSGFAEHAYSELVDIVDPGRPGGRSFKRQAPISQRTEFALNEWGLIWRRWILRGRRDTFSTSASICVAGVVLSVPP